MTSAPTKVPMLHVSINGRDAGQLLKSSTYEFRYQRADADQPWVALTMPPRDEGVWRDGSLFAVMDQHLPEGDLLLRLSAHDPGLHLQPMRLLAMIGRNGIGCLGYALPGAGTSPTARHVERRSILSMTFSQEMFDDLVQAHLETGTGISGVQPKIMLADRAGASVPTVIVKVAPLTYPGLVANEFLCLSVARRAGLATPGFELSHDGHMLLVDRFDLMAGKDGGFVRLGFEDISSVMELRVRDALAERKYQGSYQRIADLLRSLQVPAEDLHRFFEQVALSVMLRNGDAHLKNFGVLVTPSGKPRLSPVFDVVTTAVYSYTRFAGDDEQTDRTLALKLFAGRHHTRAYPTTEEMLRFGAQVCNVQRPHDVLVRIAEAMQETLVDARGDDRIPPTLLARMQSLWNVGVGYAATPPQNHSPS